MENKHVLKNISSVGFFVVVGFAARILPHPANFTPIASIALFGASYFDNKFALMVPLITMILSDFVIGFDSFFMRLTVYASFVLMVVIGFWLKKHKSTTNVVLASFSSSVIFFIFTNLAVWMSGVMYPKSFSGLFNCFLYALPFFRNTIMGDLFYSGIFFGSYELITNCTKATKPEQENER